MPNPPPTHHVPPVATTIVAVLDSPPALDTFQLEDSKAYTMVASDKLLSYPYDRSQYSADRIIFVTQQEAEERQVASRPLPRGVREIELPVPAADTNSAEEVTDDTPDDIGVYHAECSVSFRGTTEQASLRSAVLHRYFTATYGTETRCINFFGTFYRSHPDVPVHWLQMVLDDEAGYAPFLMHRIDGLGSLLFTEFASVAEEARRLAEHIEARTVEFNAWLSRSKSPEQQQQQQATPPHGVHGVIVLTLRSHLFQITLGPANVMITNRTTTTTTTTPKRRRQIEDDDGDHDDPTAPVFMHPLSNPEVDWVPLAPRALAWRRKRQAEQTQKFEREVQARRADPFPEQSKRFEPPFLASNDPTRVGQLVVDVPNLPPPSVAATDQEVKADDDVGEEEEDRLSSLLRRAEAVVSEQLGSVTTVPGLWATLPGETLAEKTTSLAAVLYTSTGEPSGLSWPPPPLHPSRVFFGAASDPPYAGASQAVPCIMRWELLAYHGAQTPLFVVLGDDRFFDILIYAVTTQPRYTALIKDYRVDISNEQNPALFYSRPNFLLDQAKDLLALAVWNAPPGQEFAAVHALVTDTLPLWRQQQQDRNTDTMPAFLVAAIVRQQQQPPPPSAAAALVPISSAVSTADSQMEEEGDVLADADLVSLGQGAVAVERAQKRRRLPFASSMLQFDRAADGAAVP